MGLSFHDIGDVFKPIVRPVEDAIHDVTNGTGGLFSDKSSLLRALANPADPIAVGQTFDRTAAGDSPRTIVRDSDGQARMVAKEVGYQHQNLHDFVLTGFDEVWKGIESAWRHFFDEVKRAWSDVGGEKWWNKFGNSIEHTVDKWGGEQRVMGWAIVGLAVVIYIILEVFTVGGATPAWIAILGLMVSFGLTQGLSPRDALDQALDVLNIGGDVDNSNFTAIDGNPGNSSTGSGSGGNAGSGLGFLGSLGDLPPLALAGLAVAGAASVWFLLAR